MPRLLAFLLIAALASGCETADDALTTSATPVAVTSRAASAIAGDMASRLAEQIGAAATTTIKMDKDDSDYASALEAALKGWGYSIITDGKVSKDQRPTELAWSIDTIDGQVLARLTTPSIALGRAYLPTATGATPASPLSIMQRN
ncbi:conjugal transfer protein TrbH [Rhizobium sp. BK251]|uniref:conjugal transfer protein TrbH n=1 Tax=Rhizobium sp. BK251 TaxID=2512125 RepID=UPI0010454319|nr:conjugal transfer protein TrbH [Rhizobium sp. BK251]TCL66348.1 conjugative transfer protein TrbH [Rhizobium sp. BK251]